MAHQILSPLPGTFYQRPAPDRPPYKAPGDSVAPGDVIGLIQVLLMLERLIEHINGHEGVEWMTFERIAEDFRARFPFDGGQRPEVI
ncbi:biotin carboxyl carrier domain-containing protein [Rubellimicrobium aerolatum]|uniref:Biotin carboxyl carrier domain-containing protein n=1 Tax=Rubellimicrobium aerolatum TaxID=490979 RepID=A0ABW0SCC8_9RHOB|nr:biotin carboxyl carrier domain-containing protein [Rubellimicrobium aerolatum]MBP1806289.1 hypothetical protein [Rubellimicrobium aerolatum]